LLFDEFDAIAPQRGHDSTGVTDRVVNQLLTELDGIESLDGVYILATTSRPDLIDVALLRPGRLDKSLLCNLPTKEERLQILECIVNKYGDQYIFRDINLEEIANICTDYCGADLQALLYDAVLAAIHQVIDNENSINNKQVIMNSTSSHHWISDFKVLKLSSSDEVILSTEEKTKFTQQLRDIQRDTYIEESDGKQESIINTKPKPVITQELILRSAKESRASVSASEKARYERTYANFIKSRGGQFDINQEQIGKYVSLA